MAKKPTTVKEFAADTGAPLADSATIADSSNATGEAVTNTDATASNEATVAGTGDPATDPTTTAAPVVKAPRIRRTFTAQQKIIASAELALKQAERDARMVANELESVKKAKQRAVDKTAKGTDSLAKLEKAYTEAAARAVLAQADADRAQALVDNFTDDDSDVTEDIKDFDYRIGRSTEKLSKLSAKVTAAQDFLVSVGGTLPAPTVETPVDPAAEPAGLPETQPVDEAILAE